MGRQGLNDFVTWHLNKHHWSAVWHNNEKKIVQKWQLKCNNTNVHKWCHCKYQWVWHVKG